MAQVKDQIAQMAVQGRRIGLVLPEHGQHLAVGAGGTVAVHQIGQQLLALAALERERTPTHEHFKVAKALHFDAHRHILGRIPQIFQHIAHISLVSRFEQEAADKDLQRFQRIFRMLGHHDQIAARLDLLDHASQGEAVHPRHLKIQKSCIHRTLTQPGQRIVCGHRTDIIAIRCHSAQDTDQRIDRKLSVVYDQNFHPYHLLTYVSKFPYSL